MSDMKETDFPPLEPQPFVTEEGREIERLRAELAAAKKRIEELEAPIRNPLSRALELEEALRHGKKEGGGA